MLNYPWKRFWYSRGGHFSLADDGFLLDPDSKEAKYFESPARPFDAISEIPCLMLLGEPGIGKSTALKTEFDRLKAAISESGDEALWFDLGDYASDDRIERKVFKCDALQTWRGGMRTLHLFLDGLDESLLHFGNIARVLRSELEELPVDRLRIRIISRSAEWQATLEAGLTELWGTGQVGVLELAPLRRADVVLAAELEKIPVARFMETILDQDLVALAIIPVTLKFLISSFARGGALPASRVKLYFDGLTHLCEEQNPHRRATPAGRGKLTANQRMAVAARIAAVTQFSNRSAIWMGTSTNLEPEDVLLGSMVGGTDGSGTSEVTVDLPALREVLDTGLFSSRNVDRQGWRHQTYAEYLAAFYLESRSIDPARLRSIILHPDGSGKVIPQLRETAAWLAGMNAQTFDLLVRSGPEVLISGNLFAASNAERASLTRQLLNAFESGHVARSVWDLRQQFNHLDNPELFNILEPYITDTSRSGTVRIAAIEIAGACSVTDLLDNLVAVALEPSENLRIRERAAATIKGIGSAAARAKLRPLAVGPTSEDTQDDLKGHSLAAVWPGCITAEELFASLTPMKDASYFGAYRRFLRSGIVEELESHDMRIAVEWAGKHVRGRDELDPVHRLASDILVRAVDHIDQPDILNGLAAALMERCNAYTNCDRIATRLCAAGDTSRRAVAAAMFRASMGDRNAPFAIMDACVMTAEDVPWLLVELSRASEGALRSAIAELIARRLSPENVDVFGKVLVAASDDQDLRAAIGPLINPVVLGTPVAEEMRTNHEIVEANRQPNASAPVVPIAESLKEALGANDDMAFFRVYCLLLGRKVPRKSSVELLPGWSEFDDNLRSQIRGAARDYLRTAPSTPPGEWWKEGKSTHGMVAAYRALHLLALESPDSLDRLGEPDWGFWTRVIVAHMIDVTETSSRDLLLSKAHERAKDIFYSALEDQIDYEDRRFGQIFVLAHFGGLWSDALAAMLRATISGKSLKPGSFRCVLRKLLQMGDAEAEAFAYALGAGAIPNNGEGRQLAVCSIAELLLHRPQRWSTIWPIFQANETLGIEVLQVVASEHEFSSFSLALDEEDIADICIWLSKLGYDQKLEERDEGGQVTPREELARWWNILVNLLLHKGTLGACDAIRRLVEALPQYEGLKLTLREAEERTRRATWMPPSPGEIIALVSKADARLVRNGQDLIEVLIESLNQLELLLQGITPSAEDLWDEVPKLRGEGRIFRPIRETSMSDYIKRHLDKTLRGAGVILNREVEIRPALGGKKGEDTDIFVDVVVPQGESGRVQRISAVIEVKGCWNPDLAHAMKNQLVDRYMTESGINYGIYAVGWFVCPQWDQRDSRYRRAPKISIDRARCQFAEQAARLSGGTRVVRSVVLNAALR